jgi:Holliday junction resolvase
MTEQQIQNTIREYLKSQGWLVVKCMAMSKPGWPDLMAIKKGRHLHIEVKRPGGRVSPLQTAMHGIIRQHGAEAFVAYGVEDVRRYLKGEG